MTKQPDFGQFFRARRPVLLDYEVRWGPNQVHDLAYVASYVNDARFVAPGVHLDGASVRIPLDRDCWESWDEKGGGELLSRSSLFAVGGVSSLSWSFSPPMASLSIDPGFEFVIAELYFGDATYGAGEILEIVLSNPHQGWRLALLLEAEAATLRVEDRG